MDASRSHAHCLNAMPEPTCSHYSLHNTEHGGEEGANVNSNSNGNSTSMSTNGGISASRAAQAGLSCAPTFVMPGFMKAGTTFVFSALTRHPHVLNPLVGVSFKETGCYMPAQMTPKKAASRMDCFPYVRRGEKLLFGDGTTHYAGNKAVPLFMRRDNPALKAVFVVRDPVARFLSHHRYNYKGLTAKGLADVNALVHFALGGDASPMQTLRAAAAALVDCLATHANTGNTTITLACVKTRARLIQVYHTGNGASDNRCPRVRPGPIPNPALIPIPNPNANPRAHTHTHTHTNRYKHAASIVKNSVYAPALMHWADVLGPQSVLTVRLEDMKSALPEGASAAVQKAARDAARAQLWRVYDFLGLCRTDFAPTEMVHVTDRSRLNADHVMNATSEAAVRYFFEPFDALMRILHVR